MRCGGCRPRCTPAPLPGPGAREPLTARPGFPVPPRVRGGSAARSPWGERETVWTVGARSLAASSAENRGRRGRAGAGAERRGARGRWGRNLPNSRAQLRGGPGRQAGEQPAGAALLEWGTRVPPVPEHQLLSGRPGPRSRRLRGSAPPIPPACPQEKKLGGRVKRVWGGWGFGIRRSEVGAGEGEVRAEWGRGQVTADGGGKAREDPWGRKWGGSHGGGKGCSGWGAASEAQTWPSPGTLLPGSRRRTDFFAHSLTHALNSLTKLPAVAAPHSPFPPLHSPRLPASPPHSVPSSSPSLRKSRVRSPLGCLAARVNLAREAAAQPGPRGK